MPIIASAIPLLPGKSEVWRRWVQELQGSRHSEYAEFLRRHGISEAHFWISETNGRELVIAYLVAQDPHALESALAMSQHPFDAWYRQKLQEFHGLDIAQIRRRRLESVFDWSEQQ